MVKKTEKHPHLYGFCGLIPLLCSIFPRAVSSLLGKASGRCVRKADCSKLFSGVVCYDWFAAINRKQTEQV